MSNSTPLGGRGKVNGNKRSRVRWSAGRGGIVLMGVGAARGTNGDVNGDTKPRPSIFLFCVYECRVVFITLFVDGEKCFSGD